MGNPGRMGALSVGVQGLDGKPNAIQRFHQWSRNRLKSPAEKNAGARETRGAGDTDEVKTAVENFIS